MEKVFKLTELNSLTTIKICDFTVLVFLCVPANGDVFILCNGFLFLSLRFVFQDLPEPNRAWLLGVYVVALVSDIAIFVLKRDVKLQLTN